VSGVPKNYVYRMIDTVTGRTDTVCKFRGITLNYNTKQLVNFKVIRDMILGTGGEFLKIWQTPRGRLSVRGREEGELYL